MEKRKTLSQRILDSIAYCEELLTKVKGLEKHIILCRIYNFKKHLQEIQQ